ncbi:MAG: exodeoxyribonuclease subunit beta, partial [Pseudomonadota bacterium]
MTERLDPLTLPLHGSRLIEASAGTGKTWTIAALYLRLVLGHGDHGTREPRALGPSRILVMTFTRAATRELSERIRERLIEAARLFRDPQAMAASGDA